MLAVWVIDFISLSLCVSVGAVIWRWMGRQGVEDLWVHPTTSTAPPWYQTYPPQSLRPSPSPSHHGSVHTHTRTRKHARRQAHPHTHTHTSRHRYTSLHHTPHHIMVLWQIQWCREVHFVLSSSLSPSLLPSFLLQASRTPKKAAMFGKRSNSMRRNPKAVVAKQGWLYKQVIQLYTLFCISMMHFPLCLVVLRVLGSVSV